MQANSDRYQKQVILDEIGITGQEKIIQARLTIVGCGGLGAIAAMYLAGAGVGHIRLIDFDTPDLTNLHRQVVYDVKKSGTKADQLAARIQELNSEVSTEVVNEQLTKQNISKYIETDHIILDCTDDLNAKYLLSDFTALNKIPLVYASIHKFIGYASVFNIASANGTISANLRHFFPEKSNLNIPSCSEVGAYNVLAGIFGLIQANEALKYILGMEILTNKLLIMNAKDYSQQKIRVNPSKKIPLQEIWAHENYNAMTCIDPLFKITWDAWGNINEEGIVISVLELDEEDPLAMANHNYPTSKYDFWKEELSSDVNYLLYCRSGQRSDILCSNLAERYPQGKFYSLKGGFMNTPKIIVD